MQGAISMATTSTIARRAYAQLLGGSQAATLAHSGSGTPTSCSAIPSAAQLRRLATHRASNISHAFTVQLGHEAFRAPMLSKHAQHEAVAYASTATTAAAPARTRRRKTAQENTASSIASPSSAVAGVVPVGLLTQTEVPAPAAAATKGRRRSKAQTPASLDAGIQQQLLEKAPPQPAGTLTTKRAKRTSACSAAVEEATCTQVASAAAEPKKRTRRKSAMGDLPSDGLPAADGAGPPAPVPASATTTRKRSTKAASVAADSSSSTDAAVKTTATGRRSSKAASAAAVVDEGAAADGAAKVTTPRKRASSKAAASDDNAAPSKTKKAGAAAGSVKLPAPVKPVVKPIGSPLAILYPDDTERANTLWHRLTLPLSGRPYNPACFTDQQAGDLRSAGIKSLFHLLTYHPRKHIHYNTAVLPGQEEQAIAVLATVKTAGTVMRAKGVMTIGKFSLEAPLQGSQVPATIQVSMFRMGHFGAAALYARFKELPQGMQVVLLVKNLKPGRQAFTWECSDPVIVSPYDKRHAWTRQLLGFANAPQQSGSLMAPPPQPTGPVAILPVYSSRSPVASKDFFIADAKIEGYMQRALRALELVYPPAATINFLQGAPLDTTVSLQQLDGTTITEHVMPWGDAIRAVHTPKQPQRLALACASLAYHELYFLMLRHRLHRKAYLTTTPGKAACVPVHDQEIWQAARDSLPFKLTAEQERVLGEILKDMQGPLAMFRLLQGDVGCGKTVVAMLAMLATVATGAQALMLAPTEILAAQHHHTLSHLITTLPSHIKKALGGASMIKPVLLTGSTKDKEKRMIMADLQAGQHRLVVSTHSALYTDSWHKLGLVIIDEQHKFGLQQRQRLLELCPSVHTHLLAMSATPIPRTLAQVMYGDMEVSIIQGKPPGRQAVRTMVLRDDVQGRQLMYESVVQEVSTGGRAFIVYPGRGTSLPGDADSDDDDEGSGKKKKKKGKASSSKAASTRKTKKKASSAAEDGYWSDEEEELEEVEKQALLTAKQEFERLQAEGVFGNHQCVLLHGGMGAEEKEAAIAMHRRGSHPIMVCTSVVEVGVDVPDASIMVVQQADRFGLAQLHQMRGRVGRSSRPSSCLLMFNDTNVDNSSQAEERLQALVTEDDGFEIALKDLMLRGAGALFSSNAKQSGNLDCSKLCTRELSKKHGPELVDAARTAAIQTITQGVDADTRAAVAAYEGMLGLVDAGLTGGAA